MQMESDTSIFCVPSLSEGLRKGLRSFVCLLFSLFFFILVIVALPVKSRRPPSWQENTQLREHVDAVVEQAEAGVARFAGCIGHQMCMAKDLVNSDPYLDTFRHHLLMPCICRVIKKIGSLKFDGETNGMRQ